MLRLSLWYHCPALAARTAVFAPEYLLREARRQKGLPNGAAPEICVLDPDGDIVRHLLARGRRAWILLGPDAPFRETAYAVAQAQAAGIAAVEMEASALYAFAQARRRDVVCFAHVTNQMGTVDNDFEKGHAGGAYDALTLIGAAAGRWLAYRRTDEAGRSSSSTSAP